MSEKNGALINLSFDDSKTNSSDWITVYIPRTGENIQIKKDTKRKIAAIYYYNNNWNDEVHLVNVYYLLKEYAILIADVPHIICQLMPTIVFTYNFSLNNWIKAAKKLDKFLEKIGNFQARNMEFFNNFFGIRD